MPARCRFRTFRDSSRSSYLGRALAWPLLRRFVVRVHAEAFRALTGKLPAIHRVGIVGGGLFPRTALILEKLFPEAHITIIDSDAANLDQARRLLCHTRARIDFIHERYPQSEHVPYDLLVIPLCFMGDRAAIYNNPPAAAVLVHDWIWRSRGTSCIVSLWLLKRMNLLVRA